MKEWRVGGGAGESKSFVTTIVQEKEAIILKGSEVQGIWQKLDGAKGRGPWHNYILF